MDRQRLHQAVAVLSAIVAVAAATPGEAGPVYTYDALGRLATVRYDDGRRITYSYDAAGNRTAVVAGATANQPPVAAPDTLNIYEEAVSGSINPRTNDSDPDGSTLTVCTVFGSQKGTASISGSNVIYTPASKRTATDYLYYTVSDGACDQTAMTATSGISVNLLNRSPVAVADSPTIPRNRPFTFDPRTNDTDPGADPLTVASATNGTKGSTTVSGDGFAITYTPVQGSTGADSFTYVLRDVDGGTATGNVNITFSTANSPPTPSLDLVQARANYFSTPVRPEITVDPRTNDSDPDGDALTVTGVTQGAKGTVTFGTGFVRYRYGQTLSGDHSDSDSFTYTVSDGLGGSSTATVNVQILVVNMN